MPYSSTSVTLFSTPLRGEKNKKTGSAIKAANSQTPPRHLSRLSFPFTGVSTLEIHFLFFIAESDFVKVPTLLRQVPKEPDLQLRFRGFAITGPVYRG